MSGGNHLSPRKALAERRAKDMLVGCKMDDRGGNVVCTADLVFADPYQHICRMVVLIH